MEETPPDIPIPESPKNQQPSTLSNRQAAQQRRRARERGENPNTVEIPIPSSSKTSNKKEDVNPDVPTFATAKHRVEHTIRTAHDLVAMGTGVEEFALTKEESDRIAHAWTEVLDAYGFLGQTKRLVLAPAIGTTIEVEKEKFKALDEARKKRVPGTEARKPPPFKKKDQSPTVPAAQGPGFNGSELAGPDAEAAAILRGEMKP